MNKEQIDEIALNLSQQVSPDGWLCGSDPVLEFTHALLAELAKVSEPVHWRAILQNHQGEITATPKIAGFQDLKAAEQFCAEKKDLQGWIYAIEPLYLHAAQPDLVAEIERLENECTGYAHQIAYLMMPVADHNKVVEQIRQQLATAQADNGQLLDAAERLLSRKRPKAKEDDPRLILEIDCMSLEEAITTHKSRKEK